MKKIITSILLLCSSSLFTYCAAQYDTLHSFEQPTGDNVYGSLTYYNGLFYGMTSNGGALSFGCIFSINPDGTGYTDLFDFNGTTGSNAQGDLVVYNNKLYGMTSSGGASGDGNVFYYNPAAHAFHDIYDFTGTNGQNPVGKVTISGNLIFGITTMGGAFGQGRIFRIDTNGTHYFNIYDYEFSSGLGDGGTGSMVLKGSHLFGMTYNGGVHDSGYIFNVDTVGANYLDIYDFTGTTGAHPNGDLTLSGNKFYGTTNKGGTTHSGVVFSIDTNGADYTVLHDFSGTDGRHPNNNVVLSGNILYGFTYAGGANADGVIFSIDTNGTMYTDIHDFNNAATPPDGNFPNGHPSIMNGLIYGITYTGGFRSSGVLFTEGACSSFSVTSRDSTPDNGTHNGSATINMGGEPTPYTYLWAPGGATTNTISGQSAGTYSCIITNPNGCKDSVAITVKSGSSGVNNVAGVSAQVSVYPDPNNGLFNLEIRNYASGIANVEVYNILGEKIYTQTLIPNSPFPIDLSSQPNGVYLYRILSDNGSLAGQGKLVISK